MSDVSCKPLNVYVNWNTRDKEWRKKTMETGGEGKMFWHKGSHIMKQARERRRKKKEKRGPEGEKGEGSEGKCWHEWRNKEKKKGSNKMCKGNRKWDKMTDWRGERETDFQVVIIYCNWQLFNFHKTHFYHGLFVDDKHLRVIAVHALIISKWDIHKGLKLINRRCCNLTKNICTEASLTGNGRENGRAGAGGEGCGEQK